MARQRVWFGATTILRLLRPCGPSRDRGAKGSVTCPGPSRCPRNGTSCAQGLVRRMKFRIEAIASFWHLAGVRGHETTTPSITRGAAKLRYIL